MTHSELNEWILARKAEGYWVTPCAAGCGVWFAQKHKGRRASYCEKQRCALWVRHLARNGRAPSSRMVLCWLVKYGDARRINKPKRFAELQAAAA